MVGQNQQDMQDSISIQTQSKVVQKDKVQLLVYWIEVYAEHIDSIENGSDTLREESSQTNVILQYKLLAAILSAVCSVIQQS